jgi:hypothetical protein
MPCGNQPVEGPGARVDDQALLLADLGHLLVNAGVVHQRALRLRDRQRLGHRHRLAVAHVVLAGHGLFQRGLLDREQRHRQADHQQIDVAELHHAERTPQQRHVLGRLGVLVVELLGAKRVGGQGDFWAHLVEQRADGDERGFPSITGRPRRQPVARRIGHRRKADAADVGPAGSGNKLGVARSDIHRPDDQVHAVAPWRS